ncbi:hypothetical protein B0J12DRAFT_563008 [Macrophomina phaseolina]|uniref:Uncharacterized protein n=1 Tax=Macrophomina phaseolina TaxID=35725 RepID=A0ABQ8GWA5_9PEZI|nr:hypothetical protein B0J12DRAFT_563008 [Macrophomina phaseolina]
MAQCAASHSQDPTETGTAEPPAQQNLEKNPTAECDAASPKYTAEDLRQAPDNLWYRLHVLTRDLRRFGDDRKALERLDRVTDPAYIGAPYFSEEEAALVKQFDAGSGSALAQLVASRLEDRLNRRMKKRVESGDYRVCAAHDLAPVFERALQLSPKDLVANVDFEKLVETNGLHLGEHENWTGLERRRQAGPVKGGNRKNRKGRKS